MEKAQRERLRTVALASIPIVLGAIAVKNIRDKRTGDLKHVSYYDASRLVFLDLIKGAQDKIIRVTGEVIHGPGGRTDIADIDIHDRDLTESEIKEIEEAFANLAQELPEDSL